MTNLPATEKKNSAEDEKQANQLKEEGNAAFKEGEWDKAINCYSRAINLIKGESPDKAVYYKNRAAVHLKKEMFREAMDDCTASLEITPNDPKALFRRCQAYEALGRFEEAYKDARQAHTVDPGNKALTPVLERLHRIVQDRLRENAQTNNKVSQMMNYVCDTSTEKEKRETAANNLVVLARERAGAECLYAADAHRRLAQVAHSEPKGSAVCLAIIRCIGELCRNHEDRTDGILKSLGVPWFLDMLNSAKEEQVNAAQYMIQTVLNALSGNAGDLGSNPEQKTVDRHKQQLDTVLSCLVYSTTSRSITGQARDATIELLTRNVDYRALDWAERLVSIKGLQRLLEVASEVPECKYESAMDITPNTRTVVSVCLAKIYENMYYDQAKERFLNNVDDYIKDKLLTPDTESKVRVVVALTCLLLGPLDIGNTIMGREGILQMILVMANTDDILQQRVACECIVAAASKKDKARAIVAEGVPILKKLYQSKDLGVRVRALVGLCKLGSSGGTDASVRPFAEGSTQKLAEACRRFLLTAKNQDAKRWAVEGLSYLTLDADVKEKLIEDREALRALFEVARSGDQSVTFCSVTALVNLANAYEKQEVIPEMVELAKFAKQHIPQEHELDDPDFVTKRLLVLAKEGVTSALVALAKTDSHNARELIARVLNALCGETELRGIVVQQGGAKALLPLALEGSERGKRQASQALARIGISIDPKVAFPGQRVLEVIRPLISLLHMECSALENFEALLALCNLAQVAENVRARIVKEGGIQKIEHYMYEDHTMLRRAATQVMTNMVSSPDVVKMFEGENDRVKFMTLLCGEEDEETAEAAGGALAMLTLASKKVCEKVLKVTSWVESLQRLLGDQKPSMRLRGCAIVASLVESSKEIAEKVVETTLLEVLMAFSQLEGDYGAGNTEEGKKVRSVATDALQTIENWGLIRKPVSERDVGGEPPEEDD
ncbi:protein unc-45 homolog B [Schistocerca nitens]|uniref:protein unc-45 homolog B n=1 Tax=Schistocerca nitens TaxID=7011 RepID=UPI002117EAC1|nr:protein unc-45 homolog B [Schistocerca nitens]